LSLGQDPIIVKLFTISYVIIYYSINHHQQTTFTTILAMIQQ